MLGTLVNAAAILIGSILGIVLSKRIDRTMELTLFPIMGVFVVLIGLQSTAQLASGNKFIICMIAVVLGSFIGHYVDLEGGLNRLVFRISRRGSEKDSLFAEGFTAATTLFCTGSMAILGSIQSGVEDHHTILFSKAVLDGITSIPMAAAMGLGVLFSSVSVLIYQGAITLLAIYFHSGFPPDVVHAISATGGVMMILLGLRMMGLIKIAIMNLLPSLIICAVAAVYYWQ
jgi:uncharacterized membrane protein YqgA involved in biofilm formation